MSIVKKTLLSSLLLVASVNATEVLATVNDTPIKKEDINLILKAQGASFDKLDKEQQKKLVDKLVERELLANIAKKAGVLKDEAYKKALENYKKDLAIKIWMDKTYKRALISDSEANKYYQSNKDSFKVPEKVHARHILVKSEEEAQKIIDELKKLKGEELKKKFIELAKSKSTGPSGKNGGDLGYFGKGQMVKPFQDAAFALKKGEITTTPVKTQFGYHIIYLEDRKQAGIADFKDVKDEIVAKMRQEQFSKAIKDAITKEKEASKITNSLNGGK